MEKTNFLASLLERHLSTEENMVEITVGMLKDKDLSDFFFKTAIATAFFASGGKLCHDKGVLASKMLKAVQTASVQLEHASKAYGQYLEKGDSVIVEGVGMAYLDTIFEKHFGDILNKAE